MFAYHKHFFLSFKKLIFEKFTCKRQSVEIFKVTNYNTILMYINLKYCCFDKVNDLFYKQSILKLLFFKLFYFERFHLNKSIQKKIYKPTTKTT